MEKENIKIVIIGAGISGLIAARVLENHGYRPIIYEKTDRAGGRVKTDIVNGYHLDHGFQVLLDAYPMAKKYLDYEKLKIQRFLPGAVVYQKGKKHTLGDPLRDVSLLVPTMGSAIGSFTDKLKIVQLSLGLRQKSIEQIFSSKETTTQVFLEKRGFSSSMINSFFKPFFSGIFLEPHLETSSRKFEFVFKMFGEGFAVLPEKGIGAIADQLVEGLLSTIIKYNAPVSRITEDNLFFEDGTQIEYQAAIIATEPLFETIRPQERRIIWKRCDTLYFTCGHRAIERPLIGLIADDEALINNIFYHTALSTKTEAEEELLSVTVVKEHNLSDEDLLKRVKHDLEQFCTISNLRFLKHYSIPRALPSLKNLKHTLEPDAAKLGERVFLAGDYLLNGSLNAAMSSGESAALGLVRMFED